MATPVNARIEEWRNNLLDMTMRNRLISLNLGRAGAVKLVHPPVKDLWTKLIAAGGTLSFPSKHYLLGKAVEEPAEQPPGTNSSLFDQETEAKAPGAQIDLRALLKSRRLRDDHILTELADKQLSSRLNRLALNAKASMTEQGVPTLYVTFGLLKWFESPDSQVQVLSPLLLFTVEMERESIGSPWEIKLQEEEPIPNHSLA